MQWLEKINEALSHIEENLDGEISYGRIAKIVGCSTYHFQRMFSFMVGIPLSEYIRRRRLTKAAFDLQQGDKVLDVALRYGYESPTSFNRAFQNQNGLSPSAARKKGSLLKAFPRITFTLSIKGAEEMNYRIEEKKAFTVVGFPLKLEKDSDSSFERIPKFWETKGRSGDIEKLCSHMGQDPKGLLGICCTGVQDKDWMYYIAVASDKPVPKGLESYTIPSATWAIFSGRGAMPKAIQDLQKQIMSEWIPSSDYMFGSAPDIERYITEDTTDQEFEVWVPILPKK